MLLLPVPWLLKLQPGPKADGMSLYELLLDIYLKYGFYKERLINIVRKGKEGADEIKAMMTGYRNNPPQMINNSQST